MLPTKYAIDYEDVLSEDSGQGTANTALLLQERLPSLWRDAYFEHDFPRAEPRSVSASYLRLHICDLYSQLELAGSVPFDQTIADRVIAVFGKSSDHEKTAMRSARGSG